MKKFVKDLTDEELEKVFQKNSKLQEKMWDALQEEKMEMQKDEGECLLDYKSNSFSIEDNYSSFYLKLRDGKKFLETTDLKEAVEYGCITEEDKKKAEELLDKYYNTTPFNTENYEEVDDITLEEIDKLATKILKAIEDRLHCYEDTCEEEVIDYFLDATNNFVFEDCYIDDNYIMYEDVAYTKCYE